MCIFLEVLMGNQAFHSLLPQLFSWILWGWIFLQRVAERVHSKPEWAERKRRIPCTQWRGTVVHLLFLLLSIRLPACFPLSCTLWTGGALISSPRASMEDTEERNKGLTLQDKIQSREMEKPWLRFISRLTVLFLGWKRSSEKDRMLPRRVVSISGCVGASSGCLENLSKADRDHGWGKVLKNEWVGREMFLDFFLVLFLSFLRPVSSWHAHGDFPRNLLPSIFYFLVVEAIQSQVLGLGDQVLGRCR